MKIFKKYPKTIVGILLIAIGVWGWVMTPVCGTFGCDPDRETKMAGLIVIFLLGVIIVLISLLKAVIREKNSKKK